MMLFGSIWRKLIEISTILIKAEVGDLFFNSFPSNFLVSWHAIRDTLPQVPPEPKLEHFGSDTGTAIQPMVPILL